MRVHVVPFSFPSSSKTSLKQSKFVTRIIVEDHRPKENSSRKTFQIAKKGDLTVSHYFFFDQRRHSIKFLPVDNILKLNCLLN